MSEFSFIRKPVDEVTISRHQMLAAKAEQQFINKLREEIQEQFHMTWAMADYCVCTWKLGHEVRCLVGQQKEHAENAIEYLKEKYGTPYQKE